MTTLDQQTAEADVIAARIDDLVAGGMGFWEAYDEVGEEFFATTFTWHLVRCEMRIEQGEAA